MPTPQVSEYVRSHNSFSGVDIKATFANMAMGELQAISYSITREKAPINLNVGRSKMLLKSENRQELRG